MAIGKYLVLFPLTTNNQWKTKQKKETTPTSIYQ
jgi:hypothetical protein